MENHQKPEIPNNFKDLLIHTVNEILGKVFSEEAEYFCNWAKTAEEKIGEHLKLLEKKLEESTTTGFLFEAFSISESLIKLQGEYLKTSEKDIFSDELINFNAEVLKLLNIQTTEPIALAENDAFNLPDMMKNLGKKLTTIFKKKPEISEMKECYLYFLLVYDIFNLHLEKLDAIEKSKADIILNLWKKSKIIDRNVAVLIGHNYNLKEAKNDFKLKIDFDDTNNLIQNHPDKGAEFIQSVIEDIEKAWDSYLNEPEVPNDNIEDNRKKFTFDQVLRATKRLERKGHESRGKWGNTLIALVDDWGLDLEISILKYQILKGNFSFSHFVNSKFKLVLDDKISSMYEGTLALLETFNQSEKINEENVVDVLNQSKTDYRRKHLLRLIPSIKNVLQSSEIPTAIDEFEKNTTRQFNALSKKRYVVKEPHYDQPTDASEMNKISPLDLVSYDIQPEFMAVFPSMKNAFIRHLQELQVRLEEIPEIVDFSIESATGFFEDKKDLKEALKVGKDGIQRAINKMDDLEELREEFYTNEVDFLDKKINQLVDKISEITDNESALQIKFRVTKAKAIEQSKAIRDKIINNIKNFLPGILDKIREFHKFIIKSSIKIRKQLEGETDKTFITTDVSDYLAETEQAVNRLPFVYQRLYKLEPLSTFDLYIERKNAQEKFKLAYLRWKNGKYAPTIIIGEKGSGKTSFINRFLASKNINEQIVYFDLHHEYHSPDTIYKKIVESLGEYINDDEKSEIDLPKKIVVIDGLEKIFEARINGFEPIFKIMQLISRTNHQLFWVVACHLYSYNYLEKSFHLSDYFGYHIELEDLSAEELITIIEKRHNISGFRLMYLADSSKKTILPLKKQSDKMDQEELKTIYFERLQKIVRGNITQAFLYWIRSAAEVTEDVIFINMPGDTNLDFVRSISRSKFEILKNILIHNGISSGKHAELFRIPPEKSQLQLQQMFDDGIIIKKHDTYNINPMIYKQVIDQMYILNLLH
ncbi:MAG: hypothetical protein JW731_16885 [Bacteroidales bacterium]|nr:hypothetical protein [Bacteroidales bacterium]